MSKATHQIEIKGKDGTGGAFSSIKARASATGAQIKAMVGGALAFAGAYVGLNAIIGGINNLGKLSDIAQKTSTSVDDLTRATGAFAALGVNVSVDTFAKSMDYLAKNTGRSGMEGFYQTIEEIGKVPEVADRAELAMKYFGRSGMEFMPIINGADETVNALKTVVAAMPAIPQSAADNGDAMADAMGFAANEVKSIWAQGLGAVCGYFDNEFQGGVREATLSAGNYVTYFVKVAAAKCIKWFRQLQEYLKRFYDMYGAFIGTLWGGGSLGDAWDAAGDAYNEAVEHFDEISEELEKTEQARTERFKRNFEERKIAVEKFGEAYKRAAISIKDREALDAEKRKEDILEAAKRQARIQNELVLGGSNAVSKLQILGPSFQNEAKKQTKLLEKIASNTSRTAENTETAPGEDMKVL